MTERGDVAYWRPHIAAVLGRDGAEPEAGYNPTFPTFLVDDVVVKFFGGLPAWRESYAAERAAYALVATDPEIKAPRVVAEGWLEDDAWPYLVTTRMRGRAWHDATPALAAELGAQVRRIHALPAPDIAMPRVHVPAGVRHSSLPEHLVAQIDDYLARLGPPDPVYVHGDLCGMHAFVDRGALTGIIDWGDALVADRHYELIQIYRDTLGCDKELFRVFLDAAAWPVDENFAHKTLAYALHRQAVGMVQHFGMDVFEPIPLDDIATLDELATTLFG